MQKLTNEKARELLKELQYAKVQMGGQLSIRDEYFKQALEKQPRWIACSEWLPAKDSKENDIIVAYDGKVMIAAFNERCNYFYDFNDREKQPFAVKITHWMPLPEAPL